MAIDTPKLDDRTFQQLVDQARRLIPHYCPEWTDHNLSDPGITLIELFAGLFDTMLYRLNRVPEKNYITFMNLMGLRLEPPQPAEAMLTFRLVEELFTEQAVPKSVPADFEVAMRQTEATEESVKYCTYHTFEMRRPAAFVVLATAEDGKLEERRRMLLTGDPDSDAQSRDLAPVFRRAPKVGDSFLIGFANDISDHLIRLTFSIGTQGAGIDPTKPPLCWEAWCGGQRSGWRPAELEGKDQTGGLNKPGENSIELHLPDTMVKTQHYSRDDMQQPKVGYWLRCRYIEPDTPDGGYDKSPQIRTIRITTIGGTTPARHAIPISQEILGRSTGEPGQSFQLAYTPLLARESGKVQKVDEQGKLINEWVERETVKVEVQDVDINGDPTGGWTSWEECDHFADSGSDDLHFTLDRVRGEVRFGPCIREPKGDTCQYGAIPKKNALIRVPRYRWGGSTQGIRPEIGTLTVMTNTLPYIDSVTNRLKARGGLDAEDIERAMLRAPKVFRNRERAVTTEDYEYLVSAADNSVARASCLALGDVWKGKRVAPGNVVVVLVPDHDPSNVFIPLADLQLHEKIKNRVKADLDERRPLGTTLLIDEPLYVRVKVVAEIKAARGFSATDVRDNALRELYRFLNPIVGGPGEDEELPPGWPFGRELFEAEVVSVLMRVPGVAYVRSVKLSAAPPIAPSDDLRIRAAIQEENKKTGTPKNPEEDPRLALRPIGTNESVPVMAGCLICSAEHEVNDSSDESARARK